MDQLPPAPREIDPAAARLFLEAAARVEFDARAFRTLGIAGVPGWKASMRNILPRLPSPACAVLSRFFIIRDPVPEHELVPALGGPSVLAAFEQAGLAERVGFGVLRCPFVMIPAAGVMAFSDAIE